MKLTARLAYSQLIINRKRTFWTLLGIVLSVAMLTAICGFIASGDVMMAELFGDNYYERPRFMSTIIGIGAVLGSIIAAVSVVVVSNAFRVSAGERTAQFGMLKSVGATKRQIASIVMYEGLWLSLIGIPIGIILGMAVHFAGVGIANYYLVSVNRLNSGNEVQLNLQFAFRWWAVAASGIASLLVVLLSAWMPARKAGKISAIAAIRGTGEIKLKAKRARSSWFIQKVFGFEGALASKSLKRSRRNFRATVVSLIVSIVIVIAANGFETYGINITGMYYPDLDVNVVADYESTVTTYASGEEGKIAKREVYPLEYELAEQITSKFREYPDTAVFGVGDDYFLYGAALPIKMLSSKMREYFEIKGDGNEGDRYGFIVSLISVDKENYTKLCETAGVPYGSNILINRTKAVINGVKSEFEPFIFSAQTLNLTSSDGLSEPFELPLHGSLSFHEVPNEIMGFIQPANISVIIPEFSPVSYEWLVKTADDESFSAYAEDILSEMLPQSELYATMVASIEVLIQALRDVRNLILTFIYGFVGMLILVGLTNVISTISTNIRSRSREFAVLRSAGMTDRGLSKMLNLESILSSVRALLFGLPIGCALSYVMYYSTIQISDFPYEFPWISVFQCVIGVFVITWVTMRYSASRLRGGSIVETIRGENGL